MLPLVESPLRVVASILPCFPPCHIATDRYVSPRFSRYQDQLKKRTLLSWLASTFDMFFLLSSPVTCFTQAYTQIIAVPTIDPPPPLQVLVEYCPLNKPCFLTIAGL